MNLNMMDLEYYLWLMLDLELMVVNFLLRTLKHLG
ncbi:hypothetical protein K0038_05186 [Pseudomonas syringae]|nr:hypothetical protein [Pseudomonas syringae]